MNLQPSEAEAGFDVRLPPTANPESLERRIAEEWAPVSRNMTFEVAILESSDSDLRSMGFSHSMLFSKRLRHK